MNASTSLCRRAGKAGSGSFLTNEDGDMQRGKGIKVGSDRAVKSSCPIGSKFKFRIHIQKRGSGDGGKRKP